MIMQWTADEVEFLKVLEETSTNLSKDYHNVYFGLQSTQSKLRIPAIVVGSFTGVASFGTSTFPKQYHTTIAIIVGLVNICIAILNTVEAYFKLGENINLAASASVQLRKLANDISKELSVDESVRETSGINFLRECYTRYQQILSGAPILRQYKAYKMERIPPAATERGKGLWKSVINYLTPSNMSTNTTARNSLEEKDTTLRKQLQNIQFYTRKVDATTLTDTSYVSRPNSGLPLNTQPKPASIIEQSHTIEIDGFD